MNSLGREKKSTENKVSLERGNENIQREKKIERKSVNSRNGKLDNTSHGILEGDKDLHRRGKIGETVTETVKGTETETETETEMEAKRGSEEEKNQTNTTASKQSLQNLKKQQILKKEKDQQVKQEQEQEQRRKIMLQSKLQTDMKMTSNFSVLASPGLNSSKVRRVHELLVSYNMIT